VKQKIVQKSFIQADKNQKQYSAVFIEYSVAEYSAGHYSAEYSADRIVGRSLMSNNSPFQVVLYLRPA
jgi:hypothetical protein